MSNKSIIEKILKVSNFKIEKYYQYKNYYEIKAYNDILDETIQISNFSFDLVLCDLLNSIHQTNFDLQVSKSSSPNFNPFSVHF